MKFNLKFFKRKTKTIVENITKEGSVNNNVEWWKWVKEIKEAEAEIPRRYILKSKRNIYLADSELEEIKTLYKYRNKIY